MGFVTHIRNLFLSTQNCPIAQCPSQVQGSLKSSLSQVRVCLHFSQRSHAVMVHECADLGFMLLLTMHF